MIPCTRLYNSNKNYYYCNSNIFWAILNFFFFLFSSWKVVKRKDKKDVFDKCLMLIVVIVVIKDERACLGIGGWFKCLGDKTRYRVSDTRQLNIQNTHIRFDEKESHKLKLMTHCFRPLWIRLRALYNSHRTKNNETRH